MKKNNTLNKEKVKIIGVFVLLFFLLLFLSCLLFYSILSHLVYAKIINGSIGLIISFSLSLVLAIVFLSLVIVDCFIPKERKFLFFLKKNVPKILLIYFIILFFIVSIKHEPMWTHEETKELLTVIWTILGLSITIFLVWHYIIVEYLKSKSPKKIEQENRLIKYELLLEKQDFNSSVESTFSTVVLLTINLYLAVFSTLLVYILKNINEMVVQTVILCTFYFSTNSLLSLFIDILKKLRQDKKVLLNDNRVTYKELKEAQDSIPLEILIYCCSEIIKKDDTLSDDEKHRKIEEIKSTLSSIELKKSGNE